MKSVVPAARHLRGVALLCCAGLSGLAALAQPAASVPATPVSVYAAGSLRAALGEVAQAFERRAGTPVQLSFGASGLLKDRLLAGERADVFASANMAHPQALAEAGRAQPVRPFARNRMCLLGAPGFSLQGLPLAQRLLDPALRVATSTPGADPAGDYAWRLFERVEASGAAGAGSAARLKARALQLTGGPNSPVPPPDRSVYGMLLAQGQADVFVTYCTNAAQAARENPALAVVPVEAGLDVSALYGVAVLQGASPAAEAFVGFLRGDEGQALLRAHGFAAP